MSMSGWNNYSAIRRQCPCEYITLVHSFSDRMGGGGKVWLLWIVLFSTQRGLSSVPHNATMGHFTQLLTNSHHTRPKPTSGAVPPCCYGLESCSEGHLGKLVGTGTCPVWGGPESVLGPCNCRSHLPRGLPCWLTVSATKHHT